MPVSQGVKIELALATAEAAKGVGEMKKALKGLKEQIATVGESSKDFKKLSAAAGELADNIGDVGDATRAFTGTGIEKLNSSFGLLTDSFKNFDPGKMVTSLKGIGAAMKAIPILLIVEGIMYLIENFEELSKGSGFLGKAMRAIGDAIQWVIDLFYKMTDAIGLTNSKLDKYNAQVVKNAEVASAALDKRVAAYDDEIAVVKASGGNTEKIEKAKRKAIMMTNKALIDQILASRKYGESFTKEQMDMVAKLTENIKAAAKEERIATAEAAKEKKEKAKEGYEDQKKMIAQIEDLKVKAIGDDYTRSLEQAKLSNERAQEEIKTSKASAKLKQQALIELEKGYELEVAGLKEGKVKADQAAADAATAAVKKAADEQKKIADDLAKAEIDAHKKVNDDIKAAAELKVLLAVDGSAAELEAKTEQLETLKNLELENAELTQNERALIIAKYEDQTSTLKTQYAEKAKKENEEAMASSINTAQQSFNAISSLTSILDSIKSSSLTKGSKEQLEHAKKQFKINKALGITSAIINTALGITKSLSSAPLAIGVVPNPAGIASLAAVVLAGVANVAKIASSKFEGGEAGGSAPSAPSISAGGGGGGGAPAEAAQPAFNSPNFFKLGQGVGGPQTIRVINVVSDTTKIQNNTTKIENRATQTL